MGVIAETVRDWWGIELSRPEAGEDAPGPQSGRALCFSAGVDSFWSLLRSGPWDDLVFVRGFDIALTDVERGDHAEASVRAIAAKLEARAVVVSTNLRAHPLWAPLDWRRTHGAALAAVGHTLIDHVGKFGISASYAAALDVPWGTHPTLDPLWSSRALAVQHIGAELWKREKLRVIADEPLVQEHLRVCWEHRRPGQNCSACEKCLRTMCYLAQAEKLAQFKTFDGRDLPRRVDALRHLPAGVAVVWEEMAADGLPDDLGPAVQRLLRRSRSWRGRSLRASTSWGGAVRRRLRSSS
ncbi:hypothetical protein [Nocardioides zhouii]|uniref:Uncharacterized protein n=1 Tax=Nocardioides zhouii TaxID=1168729 RepID=A0A4Q2T6P3_9ACTN|nr:hypothetical protein [Nocardioides zhouii]RYC14555.1 hypothetical protein EUA94_00040 [Nocardioides zhouii]